MKSAKPPISDPEKINEAIIAYLDGELGAEAAREIEERLATDAPFREKLQRFQNSWDLLDELPRTEADMKFAASTVEMVALSEDRQRRPAERSRRWTLVQRGSFMVMVTLATCFVGFLMTNAVAALLSSSGLISDPDKQLLNDLPIVENLDKYLVADNVEFLRALSNHPRAAEVRDARIGEVDQTSLVDENNGQRRARIKSLSQQDENRLIINRRRFGEMDSAQQDKLRAMHRQLSKDPQREQLLQTMDAYYHWFLQLTPAERIELRSQSSEQRLMHMGKLLAEQRVKAEARRVRADVRAVQRWLVDVAVKNRELLAQGLPRKTRDAIERSSQGMQPHNLMRRLWARWDNGQNAKNPAIEEEDWVALKGSLSPQLRKVLEDNPDPEAGFRALVEKLPKGFPGLSPGRRNDATTAVAPLFAVAMEDASDMNKRELWRFFHEELTEDQQKRLRGLPHKEFWRKLRAEFVRSRFHAQQSGQGMKNGRPTSGGPGSAGPKNGGPNNAGPNDGGPNGRGDHDEMRGQPKEMPRHSPPGHRRLPSPDERTDAPPSDSP